MVRVGYKQTEVGEIPEDWDVKPVCEITDRVTNGFVGTATTHYTDSDDGVVYIQGYNVEENSFNFHGIKRVTKDFHLKHKKSSLREADLLTVQTGDVGLTTIVPKSLVEANCHALIISRFKKEKSYPLFYAHYFNSSQGRLRLKELEVGTTMKHINVSDLLSWDVPYPRYLEEQKTIADALSDVNDLISSLEKLIAKKRDIKSATMQQLLTGKKRLPGFGEGKGYKQTELGQIPEDWDVKPIGKIARVTRGASPRPIDSPIWFNRNSNVGWLRISDVTRTNKYLYETTQNLSEKGIANSRFVSSNNLVMSICATVGRPILTRKNVCIHDGFVGFSNMVVNMEYLYYVLADIEGEWSKHGQTGSQMNLNTGLINNTSILLPDCIGEQTAIAEVLSNIDDELSALNSRLNKTKSIKQGMMQELLTGRTRLIDPHEAVAEEERMHGT